MIANTFDAHRLLWFADQPSAFGATADTQPQLARALHRAHFTDGQDIASVDVLVRLATELDLDPDRVRDLLNSTEGTADVRAQLARAHDLGITSVPTFIFAGKYAVSGAQPTETFASVLAEVARREKLTPTVGSLIPQQRTAPAAEDDTRVSSTSAPARRSDRYRAPNSATWGERHIVSHAFQVDLRGMVDLLSHHLYGSPRVYVRSCCRTPWTRSPPGGSDLEHRVVIEPPEVTGTGPCGCTTPASG